MTRATILATVALAAMASEASAQELAGRVAAVGEGSVTLTFPTRPGVEVCTRGVSIGGRRTMWRWRGRDAAARCASGPVSVELRVAGGTVRDLDVLELDEAPEPGARSLGMVSAPDAAAYFLGLARSSPVADVGNDVAEDALFAGALADVADVWRELLDIARDASLEQDVRGASLFWLGQEAGEAVTRGVAEIAADEREEQDVREAAIFALSQRPGDAGMASLMELARTAREAETRRTAMFWLAQSEDARVTRFFEEILLGR